MLHWHAWCRPLMVYTLVVCWYVVNWCNYTPEWCSPLLGNCSTLVHFRAMLICCHLCANVWIFIVWSSPWILPAKLSCDKWMLHELAQVNDTHCRCYIPISSSYFCSVFWLYGYWVCINSTYKLCSKGINTHTSSIWSLSVYNHWKWYYSRGKVHWADTTSENCKLAKCIRT